MTSVITRDEVEEYSNKLLQNIPSHNKPVFVLIYGTVDVSDEQALYADYRDDHVPVDVLETFKILSGKPIVQFNEGDIKLSMYLASMLAVKAFYNKQSIITQIGVSEDVTDVIEIMKTLGYEVSLVVNSCDDAPERWQALDKTSKWVLTNRDYINRDLIAYLFEDITGVNYADYKSSGATKLVMTDNNGHVIGSSES
ncbi:hypothetical protein [Psychrobacter lutiphocae]|uniref:hypothetical protein n=1 Tax=Psychrobacter lutiphocae TaxID=540500 RepID=UPI00037401B9|nr:hypothetical protein [Psychrobacter lutiphocae]